jgi:hypothetical protein
MTMQNQLPAQRSKQPMVAYPGSTMWTNPTQRTVRFTLHKGPPAVRRSEFQNGAPVVLDSGRLEVEILPGDSVLLPSVYDDAIQTYDAAGVVQWGHAPQLVKNGTPHDMHPSLDPLEQQRLDSERKATEAIMEKNSADAAVLVAAGRRIEAERLQKEALEARARDHSAASEHAKAHQADSAPEHAHGAPEHAHGAPEKVTRPTDSKPPRPDKR